MHIVEILGKAVILYRGLDGKLGLLDEHCSHRGASLGYGIVEENTIRCPYHGWQYNIQGECIDRPTCLGSSAKRDLLHPSYKVSEYCGLIWAHFGLVSSSSPPKFRFMLEDGPVLIRKAIIPCNWLQIVENSLDPIHLEWLHGHLTNHVWSSSGRSDRLHIRRHEKVSFDRTGRGIVKRRTLAGQTVNDEDWSIGQETIFPTTLCIVNPGYIETHFRTPINSFQTLYLWYRKTFTSEHEYKNVLDVQEARVLNPDGSFIVDTLDGQDYLAWVSQGPVSDRTRENLDFTDSGILLYREMLLEAINHNETNDGDGFKVFDDEFIDLLPRSYTLPVLDISKADRNLMQYFLYGN